MWNVFVPEAHYFVSGSCGGRTLAFSFIVLINTKVPMYSCRHILDFSLFLPLSQSCSVSGQKCDIALCNLMCTLAGLCNKKKLLSPLPGGAQGGGSKGARPCRGSQPQITALLMPPQPQKHHSLQFILKPLAPFSSFAIH